MNDRLYRLQDRLWRGRFWWLGNLISDARYWCWRLTGGER